VPSFGNVPALAVWTAERIAAGGAEVVQSDARVAGEADGRPNLVGSYHYWILPKKATICPQFVYKNEVKFGPTYIYKSLKGHGNEICRVGF
jgi:hypothetical protein